jgi:hypothetical protein
VSESEKREIPGFPGYFADKDGNIWCNRVSGPGNHRDGMRMRRSSPRPDGYIYITLSRDGKTVGRPVHALVLETFVGPRPPGFHACHTNGVRHDNRLENLRWDSPTANLADRVAHGTMPSRLGENNPCSKLTTEKVLQIRYLRERGATLDELSEQFGVHRGYISQICRRERWSHI